MKSGDENKKYEKKRIDFPRAVYHLLVYHQWISQFRRIAIECPLKGAEIHGKASRRQGLLSHERFFPGK